MHMGRWLSLIGLVAAAFGLTGCTHYLWTSSRLAEPHLPSQPNNLQLFEAPQRQDFLVRYDELPFRGAPKPRVYFLWENEAKVKSQKPPHFLKQTPVTPLIPLPLTAASAFNPGNA